MNLLTYLTIGVALLMVFSLFVFLFLRRRGVRPKLSEEQQQTAEGLQKVASRTGSRWGTASNVNDEAHGHHGSADSSGGGSSDAGGGSD